MLFRSTSSRAPPSPTSPRAPPSRAPPAPPSRAPLSRAPLSRAPLSRAPPTSRPSMSFRNARAALQRRFSPTPDVRSLILPPRPTAGTQPVQPPPLPAGRVAFGEGFTEEMGNYMNQGPQMFQQPQIDPMAQQMMGNRLGQVLGQNMNGRQE